MTKLIKYYFLIFACFIQAEPFQSTYEPLPSENILIRNANIYDGEGNEFIETDLLIQNRKIVAIGKIYLALMILKLLMLQTNGLLLEL